MFLFLIKFLITNIVFSVMLCSLFIRFNNNGRHSNSELLLYSLGLGPAFTTLLLYYFFLLFPHHSNLFYLILIVTSYFLIALVGRKYFKLIFLDVKKNIKKVLMFEDNETKGRKIEHIVLVSIVLIPLAVFLFFYLTKILPQPLIGWDSLIYGMKGKVLFGEKSLAPIWGVITAASGFSAITSAPPSFPLLLTWEELINYFFHAKSDLYYKSITTYYGLLLLSVVYFWVAKLNKWAATLAAFALLSGLLFFISLLQPHLDLYRIFFLSVSIIWLAHAVKNKDLFSIIMLGIFSGFTAFAHRIGVVMAVMNCIVFFVTIESNFKERVLKSLIVACLIIACGASHYIFDLIFGQGIWIHPLKYK